MNINALSVLPFFVVPTSCAGTDSNFDLSSHFQPASGSFCEIMLGDRISEIPVSTTPVSVENESGVEVRYSAALCEGTVPSTLTVDDTRSIDRILFNSRGQCFDGICMGESYQEVLERFPNITTFMTREEGGVFVLYQRSDVRYTMDSTQLRAECYSTPASCREEVLRTTVEGIAISE